MAQGPARLWLAALALLLLASLSALATANPDQGAPADGQSDQMLYAAVIDGVRAGGDYYTVAADALRNGSYPLRPFVAVRLPTLAMVSASLPPFLLTFMLWALALAVGVAWYVRLSAALGRPTALLAALLLLTGGMTAAFVPGIAVFHEIWAGLLIALSLAVRRPGRVLDAVSLGLAAALVRETAILYLLIMAMLAWRAGARREAAGWLTALAILALVVGLHAHAVLQVIRPSDAASPGWLGLLGPGFAARAVASCSPLIALPLALAAPLVALSLAGWTAWRDPLAIRAGATLAGYLLLLAIFARADNFYWALLVTPISLLGLLFAADGLRDLIVAALDNRRITVTRIVR